MDLQKLNPWNWFKHEESEAGARQIPVTNPAGRGAAPAGAGNPVLALHEQIDQLIEDAFRGFGFQPLRPGAFNALQGSGLAEFRPSLNVSGDNASYQVTLEAPGMTESELDIEVSGDVLTIRGEKEEEKETKERHFFRVERSYGAFQRTLSLPDDVNTDEIDATMKNGVLTITLPRQETVDSSTKKVAIHD